MKACGSIVFFAMALMLVAMSFVEIASGCLNDEECSYADICYRGRCKSACHLRNIGKLGKKCGENAACFTHDPHTYECRCQPDHMGDPEIGCLKVSHEEYMAYLNNRY